METRERNAIQQTFKKINDLLKGSNRLLVLDFSHFSHVQAKLFEISVALYGYQNLIQDIYKPKLFYETDTWSRFSEDNVKLIYNYRDDYQYAGLDSDRPLSAPLTEPPQEKKVISDFIPEMMVGILNKPDGFGGCMFFISKSYNDPEAQSTLYATFEKPFPGIPFDEAFDFKRHKGTLENSVRISTDDLMEELQELLVGEMVHSLFEQWRTTEAEKIILIEREAERHATFEKLFHAQKQHLTGLNFVADTIIHTDPTLSEFILYLRKSLAEFLEISRYLSSGNFQKEDVHLNDVISSLVDLVTRLISDENIIGDGFKIRDHQVEPLLNAGTSGTLFSGNFSNANVSSIKCPVGVPKLILKEVIVNSMLHAYYNDPKISIDILENTTCIIIEVKNNRCASEKEIEDMYSPSSDDKHGMRIINELCEKIGWEAKYLLDEANCNTIVRLIIRK